MKAALQLLLFSVLLLTACCSAAEDRFDKNIVTFERKPADYPDALIQGPKAKGVRYYELRGRYQLTYVISTENPTKEAVEAISAELKRGDWTPLPEDWLNPGLPSSHVVGWSVLGDSRDHRKTKFQWLADWEDSAGAS